MGTWGALLLASCVHALPPTMVPDHIVAVRTDDGWINHLRHYAGPGEPVLMVHGMGANHYNFDYRGEVSLAHALSEAGWDVWIADLRGDPLTVPPDPSVRWDITFDDYARRDVAVAVRTVLAETGAESLHWVGHSLGGMLLYAWIAQAPETIASGVTICSPSEFAAYTSSWAIRHSGWMVRGEGRIPARGLGRALAPWGRINPMFSRLAVRGNLDWGIAKGMAREALSDIPKPVARQGLAWIDSGTFATVDGRPWIAAADVPLLVLGATEDRVVAEADVAATCDRYPDCTYRALPGMGHVDPAIGRTASTEVFPLILDFLDVHRVEPVVVGPASGG